MRHYTLLVPRGEVMDVLLHPTRTKAPKSSRREQVTHAFLLRSTAAAVLHTLRHWPARMTRPMLPKSRLANWRM